ncbi:MAG: 3-hydroxybutyrate dehydrogenase [Chloroflexi bacterium]|nr:MAG: 3-hydroxybutyrate dehydrogenase [Chloroflexota bacterium]
MTDKVFDGKVAVVTGAASGIGLACAERFAADGAQVVISDVNAERGMAAAERLQALFVHGDLSLRADCKALINRTIEEFGTVHILVNNAGFQHIDPVEDFPEDTWDKMIALMLTAPFLLTRYAWPAMKAQKWGRIVNIGSVHSLRASPFKAAYISAKHGMLGLTRTTALEGGPHNITVNLIAPSYVRTPLVENQIAAQARTRGISEDEVVEKVMLKPLAVKKLVEPSEVASLAAYLCRPEASVMSGTPVVIDGAWTAG